MTRAIPRDSDKATPRRWAVGALVVALLLIHWVLAVTSARNKCTTFDEIGHLTAGVSLWRTGDFRLFPDHPPLAHLWAGLPVALGDFRLPDLNGPAWKTANPWVFGRQFFYECGNDAQAMLLRGRMMIALFSVALGFAVWAWSQRLFGEAGGLLSLALYAFSPTMLAHARLVTTDMAAALFFVLATAALWRSLHVVSIFSVLASALAIAALILSKMSGVLIIFVAGALLIVRLVSGRPTVVVLKRRWEVRHRLRQAGVWLANAAAQVALVIAVIWLAYGLHYGAARTHVEGAGFFTPEKSASNQEMWDAQLSRLGVKGQIIEWAREHRILPEAQLFGLAFVLNYSKSRASFLNGQSSNEGWWYFFPYCFAVKTPMPLLALLVLALGAAVYRWRRAGKRGQSGYQHPLARAPTVAYHTIPLWVLLAVYWASALNTHLNIGHRHVLPIYPVIFILAGSLATVFTVQRKAWAIAPVALVALFVGASLRMWPDYLAYFNTFAGGPNRGFHHLVDGSLDWGQDLPGLHDWLIKNARDASGEMQPVYLSYFGTGDPPYYGIDAIMLPSCLPWDGDAVRHFGPGIYCISATTMEQVGLLPECRWTQSTEAAYQRALAESRATGAAAATPCWFNRLAFARLCAHLRSRRPDDNVGHSILIYRVSQEEIDAALHGEPPGAADDTQDNLFRLAEYSVSTRCPTAGAVFLERLKLPADDPRRTRVAQLAGEAGSLFIAAAQPAEAIAMLRVGHAYDPHSAGICNNLAWLLATCPSADLRDGAEAVRLARSAMAQLGEHPTILDTLAAALAETGDFDEAVRCARRAAELATSAGGTALANDIQRRIELYRRGTPYHEP